MPVSSLVRRTAYLVDQSEPLPNVLVVPLSLPLTLRKIGRLTSEVFNGYGGLELEVLANLGSS